MEPSLLLQRKGCAPIIGWTEPSPTHTPIVEKTLLKNLTQSSPTISSTSSGIDLDKSSFKSTSDYSPTVSSICDEPIYLSTNKKVLNNNDDVDENLKRHTVEKNPTPEGVKFIGISDDSICSKDDDYDSDEKEDTDDKLPKIPDGGWGWMVVLSSFVLSAIADGISFSFGLIYIEFLDHFGESKSKTSWIGSLFLSVPLMSGPIMSALVDKYGCRNITMLGGLISCIGFVLSSFSNSIEMLLLNFGIIAGFGLGMCYVTSVVSIAYWFDKKRTLAVGLGACGTGVGTFIYAPMTRYFIESFGWRGTILLLAGTLLNMCVCGAIMRDPEWWILEQKKQLSQSNKSMRGASSCGSVSRISGGAESTFLNPDELKDLIKSGETPEYILTTLATSIAAGQNEGKPKQDQEQLYTSVINLPTFLKQSEKVPLEVLEQLSANKKLYNVILENYPSLLSCRSCSENKLMTDKPMTRMPIIMSMKVKESKKTTKENDEYNTGNVMNSPLLPAKTSILKSPTIKSPTKPNEPWIKKQFSNNQNYLKNIKLHRNSVMYRGAMLNIAKYRLRASSCPNIYRNSIIHIDQEEEKWYTDTLDTIKSMFDFKLFMEFHFLLISMVTLILYIWFIIPYFYIAEHLVRNGYTEDDGALQISIIGIANTIGMVFLGWAGDQPWMNIPKTYAVCLFFCGVATLAYPLVTYSHYLLSVTSTLFGLLFASSFSFTPVILVELVPLERFSNAYGLILLCQGIGNLIGPPLAGFIFDLTNSWDLTFYLAGFFIIISGMLVWILPVTDNFRIIGSAPLEKDLERISQLSQRDSSSIA